MGFMKVINRISIKSFLFAIVGVLAVVLTALSISNALRTYAETKEIKRIAMANELSDLVISAAANEAKERGLTSALLSSATSADNELLRELNEARAKGDDSIKKASAVAKTLVEADGSNVALKSSFDNVTKLYGELEATRKVVDREAGREGAKNFPPQEFIKQMNGFIDANAEFRLSSLTSASSKSTLQEALAMNIELKQAVWLVSEYAGRERATLGGFIAGKKPLDQTTLEKLNSFKAIVDINIKPIVKLKEASGMDQAVLKAVSKMEDVFLTKFKDLRTSVYAADKHFVGEYNITGKEWIERATEGIDSVLGVSTAVGQMVSGKVAVELSAAKRGMTISLIILAGTMILSIFSIWVIRTKVVSPMHYLNDTMSTIENTNDLTLSINVKSQDESGQMATTFNKMISKFHSIIKDLHSSIEHLASSSEELSASATQIAGGSKSQSARATQVSTAAQEMSATIIEVAKNVSAASDAAREASGVATKGGEIVTQTIDSMNGISRTAKDSSQIISKLGSRSHEIGNIINVIDDIADQTNLLALNAAIEAARAGEQGRGFAVVADEVRKLAEKTMTATKEIGAMIKAMQDETAKAITSVENEVKAVESGVKLAKDAGDALREIVSKVDVVTSMIHQVSTASEQQSAAVEQISSDIESVANVITETSASADQIAKASMEMAELSTNLKSAVEMFKISTTSASDVIPMKETKEKPGKLRVLKGLSQAAAVSE